MQQLVRMVAENNKEFKELRQEVRALSGRFDALESRMTENEKRISQLTEEFQEFRYEFASRFDRLERHLRLVDADTWSFCAAKPPSMSFSSIE